MNLVFDSFCQQIKTLTLLGPQSVELLDSWVVIRVEFASCLFSEKDDGSTPMRWVKRKPSIKQRKHSGVTSLQGNNLPLDFFSDGGDLSAMVFMKPRMGSIPTDSSIILEMRRWDANSKSENHDKLYFMGVCMDLSLIRPSRVVAGWMTSTGAKGKLNAIAGTVQE